MKRALITLALTAIGTCAIAGGRYDGIYASPLSNVSWVSVHHNDSRMIAAAFESTLQFSGTISTPLGNTTTSVLSTWSLLGGSFSGNSATVSGEMLFGACKVTLRAVFTDSNFQLFPVSSEQTSQGIRTNFNCNGYLQGMSWPVTYQRIF